MQNREIKFRQWKDGGFTYWGKLDEGFTSPESSKFDKFPTEQFTGLYDKNGVEIYEGDIVRREFHTHGGATRKTREALCVIEWLERDACFIDQLIENIPSSYSVRFNGIDNSVVVTNIHESPELLNAE